MTTRQAHANLLLVEDNADLAFGLQRNLEFEGYTVEVAADGRRGLSRALDGDFDLIILDLMLPKMDGMKVLQQLRSAGASTAVLILTARGEEFDKVRGLRSGADDYLTKPFGVLELIARVEAILRRAGKPVSQTEAEVHEFGEVVVDVASRTVCRHGKEVAVPPREFELLVALLRKSGAAASRAELLRDVWGHKAEVETRTVDTHIAELRRKLESDAAAPEYILTVRKFGYRIDVGTAAGS